MNSHSRVVALVTAAIAISYFDRQTLPVAVSGIERTIPLNDEQFSWLQFAFLIPYALLYAAGGQMLDVMGTRRGFTLIMLWWSGACALHGLATNFGFLFAARCLLGMGRRGSVSRGDTRSGGVDSVRWPQRTLVIAQAALSLVLLSAAALLGDSLRNLDHQNFGFDMSGRSVAWIDPSLANYKPEQLNLLYQRVTERISAIPGVRKVSAVLYAPMSGDNWNTGVLIEGKPDPGAKDKYGANWVRVTPGFFETVGNPILMGRPITDQDRATTRNVAVINEAFAKQFFGGENPIGKHFGPDKRKYAGMWEIVGVAANMRYLTYGMKEPVRPMFFLPEAQVAHFDEAADIAGDAAGHYLYNLVLWAPDNPPYLEAQVRRALADIDPNLALYSVDPYQHLLDTAFSQQNMIATLTLLFGGLALVLAAVGLYGVTAYTVEQRTTEIGVRMALGADRRSVVAMVLRSAFWQVGIGLLLGVPAALASGRLITDQLYGVKSGDPMMLGGATFCLGLAALIAALIPAQRAANLDPVVALRAE